MYKKSNNKKFNNKEWIDQTPYNLRVYLKVPFSEKDKAKSLGCKWDQDMKMWYCQDYDNEKFKITECIKLWPTPKPFKVIDGSKILVDMIKPNDRGYTLSCKDPPEGVESREEDEEDVNAHIPPDIAKILEQMDLNELNKYIKSLSSKKRRCVVDDDLVTTGKERVLKCPIPCEDEY